MTESLKNDPDLLHSATGAGLLYFFDVMIKRNEVNKSTGGALRTASKKYLELEDNPDAVDVRNLDHDSMHRRFVIKHRIDLNEKSLETYGHRFRQAVEMYLAFIEGRDWNIIRSRTTGQKARPNGTRPETKVPPPPADRPVADRGTAPLTAPPSGMTTFPIPLRPGVTGKLTLPDDLTPKEAKKVVAIVTALAVEEQLALPARAADC